MNRRSHLRRRRRGAYFVELAFTLIPMLAVLLAIVDYSMPVFFRSLLTHAAREGARYAITYRTSGVSATHTASIQDVVMSQSAGFLSGATGREKIHVDFIDQVSFTTATGSDRNKPGNIAVVSIQGFEWRHMLPLYRMGTQSVTINASSADRLETLPAGAIKPAP